MDEVLITIRIKFPEEDFNEILKIKEGIESGEFQREMTRFSKCKIKSTFSFIKEGKTSK